MPFCAVPFIHSYIDTKGKNRICCAAKWTPGQYDLQDWEGKDYQKIREAVSSDDKEWLPECNECKRREEAGQEDSYRKINNKLYEQLDRPELNIINGTNFEVPISYDLRMNNLCNLSCRMCGPKFSLQIQKEAKKHPELWPTHQFALIVHPCAPLLHRLPETTPGIPKLPNPTNSVNGERDAKSLI